MLGEIRFEELVRTIATDARFAEQQRRRSEQMLIDWKPILGSNLYRLCRREIASGKTETLYKGAETAFAIPAEVGNGALFRVEAYVESLPGFVTIVPFASFELPTSKTRTLTVPDPDPSVTAWRLRIRGGSNNDVLADLVSAKPVFTVDETALTGSPRYRFLAWDWREKKWRSEENYNPLPTNDRTINAVQDTVGAKTPFTVPPATQENKTVPTTLPRRDSLGKPSAFRKAGLAFMITVDTEANLRNMRNPRRESAVDEQVFARWNGREVGINFMMDQAERRGAKAVFFVDVLMEYQFGRPDLERTIDAIASRGHDIQLHLHPSPHLAFSADERLKNVAKRLSGGGVDPEAFKIALDLSIELFKARVGKSPIAFRNGSYHIHDSYFTILRDAGIRYDTSVFNFKNCKASPWVRARTQPFEVVPGLWELPVSWTLMQPLRPVDRTVASQYTPKIDWTQVGLEQSLAELQRFGAERPRFVVAMLHSYNYLLDKRSADPAVAQAWNRMAKTAFPADVAAPNMKRDENVGCTFYEEPAEGRIASMEAMLDALRSSDEVITFEDLRAREDELLGAPVSQIELLPEFDRSISATRITAIRKYSEDFLRHMDETSVASQDPAGRPIIEPPKPIEIRVEAGKPATEPALEPVNAPSNGSAGFNWPAVEGASSYRVIEQEPGSGKRIKLYEGEKNSIDLPDLLPRSLSVEVKLADRSDFTTLIPFAEHPSSEPLAPLTLDAKTFGDETAWRLVSRHENTEGFALDVVSTTPRISIDQTKLKPGRYRFRFLRWLWRDRRWEPESAYADLPKAPEPTPATTKHVTASKAKIAARPKGSKKSTGAKPGGIDLVTLVTIDTEASLRYMRNPAVAGAVDHQVFGSNESRDVGIGLIMDQLERRGMRGVFFVDVLMEYEFGQAALEKTIDAIKSRGHDIQLHLHPSPHLAYRDEKSFQLCLELFRGEASEAFSRSLDLAMELFQKRVGKAPLAFRNGSYVAYDRYFDILRAAGIRYDSSIYSFKNCNVDPALRFRMRPFEIRPGLWELPVSWFVARRDTAPYATSQFSAKQGWGLDGIQSAYVALAEQKSPLANFAVVMLHSYTYLKETKIAGDEEARIWNDKFELICPSYAFPYLRRSMGAETIYLEAAYQERIDSIDAQLDQLATIEGARVMTFDAIAARHDELFGSCPFEPLVEFDRTERRARISTVRRYSGEYLRRLDSPTTARADAHSGFVNI